MLEKPETIIKVLRFLERKGGQVHVRELAKHLWPESPVWKTPAKGRNAAGPHKPGARLHTAAACLCGRLASQYLLRRASKGIYEITERGRQYLSAPLAPAVPADAPGPQAPVALPLWRWGWVFWPDGRWYQALIGQAQGNVCPIAFNDGRQYWVDPRCVA